MASSCITHGTATAVAAAQAGIATVRHVATIHRLPQHKPMIRRPHPDLSTPILPPLSSSSSTSYILAEPPGALLAPQAFFPRAFAVPQKYHSQSRYSSLRGIHRRVCDDLASSSLSSKSISEQVVPPHSSSTSSAIVPLSNTSTSLIRAIYNVNKVTSAPYRSALWPSSTPYAYYAAIERPMLVKPVEGQVGHQSRSFATDTSSKSSSSSPSSTTTATTTATTTTPSPSPSSSSSKPTRASPSTSSFVTRSTPSESHRLIEHVFASEPHSFVRIPYIPPPQPTDTYPHYSAFLAAAGLVDPAKIPLSEVPREYLEMDPRGDSDRMDLLVPPGSPPLKDWVPPPPPDPDKELANRPVMKALVTAQRTVGKVIDATSRTVTGVANWVRKYYNHPELIRPGLKNLWETVKHELKHYWNGSKLLAADIRTATSLVMIRVRGGTLTRRERRQLVRTTTDIFRLVPFTIIVVIPFLEFALPILLKLFPNMLPSQFQDKHQEAAKVKTELRARLELADFLQDTMESMARQKIAESQAALATGTSDKGASTAERMMSIIQQVRSGQRVDNAQLITVASLFRDDITLDNLSRPHLVAMCKYMKLPQYGSNTVLRERLRDKVDEIRKDDEDIVREGIESLTLEELREACRDRGMRSTGLTAAGLRRNIANWIDLSVNKQVPASLLLLSRALSITERPPAEAIQMALSTIDTATVDEVFSEAGLDREDPDRRLETMRRQNMIIDEENVRETIQERKRQLAAVALAVAQQQQQQAAQKPVTDAPKIITQSVNKPPPSTDTTLQAKDAKTGTTTPSPAASTPAPGKTADASAVAGKPSVDGAALASTSATTPASTTPATTGTPSTPTGTDVTGSVKDAAPVTPSTSTAPSTVSPTQPDTKASKEPPVEKESEAEMAERLQHLSDTLSVISSPSAVSQERERLRKLMAEQDEIEEDIQEAEDMIRVQKTTSEKEAIAAAMAAQLEATAENLRASTVTDIPASAKANATTDNAHGDVTTPSTPPPVEPTTPTTTPTAESPSSTSTTPQPSTIIPSISSPPSPSAPSTSTQTPPTATEVTKKMKEETPPSTEHAGSAIIRTAAEIRAKAAAAKNAARAASVVAETKVQEAARAKIELEEALAKLPSKTTAIDVLMQAVSQVVPGGEGASSSPDKLPSLFWPQSPRAALGNHYHHGILTGRKISSMIQGNTVRAPRNDEERKILREYALRIARQCTRMYKRAYATAEALRSRGREKTRAEQQEETEEARRQKQVKALGKQVTAMLRQLEAHIDIADATIGDKLHLLDKDKDGRVSTRELQVVLREHLKAAQTDEEARALVNKLKALSASKGWYMSVEEIQRLAEEYAELTEEERVAYLEQQEAAAKQALEAQEKLQKYVKAVAAAHNTTYAAQEAIARSKAAAAAAAQETTKENSNTSSSNSSRI